MIDSFSKLKNHSRLTGIIYEFEAFQIDLQNVLLSVYYIRELI